MSAGSQLSMNPGVLRGRNYILSGGGRFEERLTPVGGMGRAWQIGNANAQCSVDFVSRMGDEIIELKESASKAFRCLPYQPDGVTCLEPDDNAQLILTGPLTGCHVYVARSGNRTLLLHANANSDKGEGNAAVKLRDARAAIAALVPCGAITNTLVWERSGTEPAGTVDYADYQSFVIGCKPRCGVSLTRRGLGASLGASDWRFYVYGYGLSGTMLQEF